MTCIIKQRSCSALCIKEKLLFNKINDNNEIPLVYNLLTAPGRSTARFPLPRRSRPMKPTQSSRDDVEHGRRRARVVLGTIEEGGGGPLLLLLLLAELHRARENFRRPRGGGGSRSTEWRCGGPGKRSSAASSCDRGEGA